MFVLSSRSLLLFGVFVFCWRAVFKEDGADEWVDVLKGKY
jgi:hypothetical protein